MVGHPPTPTGTATTQIFLYNTRSNYRPTEMQIVDATLRLTAHPPPHTAFGDISRNSSLPSVSNIPGLLHNRDH